MLLRRHREASVKAPAPLKEPDQLEDTNKGQADPGGSQDPAGDGQADPTGQEGQEGHDDDYSINYDELSYDELQDIAKKRGIPANIKKAELIEALKASE